MIGANVARRYAKALYELGSDAGTLSAVVTEVGLVAEAYEASAELRSVLHDPLIALAVKRNILTEVADRAQVSTIVKNALLLLGDRRRLAALPAIAQLLREMGDLKGGIVRAEVTTATKLSEDYYKRLQQQLEKLTGKRVVIDRREDPSLIAGVVARIGDMVLDGSLRTRLQEMRGALLPD